EPRKILLVADASPGLGSLAGGLAASARMDRAVGEWQRAMRLQGWYAADLAPTNVWLEMKPTQLATYEALVLAELVDPGPAVWEKAKAYVEGGGKLIVLPGADELLADGPDKPPPGYDNTLLPGVFKKWITLDFFQPGKTWAWDAMKPHPMLNDIKEWVHDRN